MTGILAAAAILSSVSWRLTLATIALT
jgi:hypothetical protein